ncbi:hypothetical protein, partial [Vibrio breoganii]|uniref:hypothetical protein n=1 Tax=Vibrio breoganii TaxID=553239 RepID=UPI001A7E13FE
FEISNRGAKRCVLTQVQNSPKSVILECSYRVSTFEYPAMQLKLVFTRAHYFKTELNESVSATVLGQIL